VMAGRDYVAPHDVTRVAACALGHRMVVSDRSRATAAEVVAECLAAVPAPRR
jgi:MoxR-like ATPase